MPTREPQDGMTEPPELGSDTESVAGRGRPPMSGRALLRLAARPFQHFARSGARGGILLLACTAAALVWANSPWSESYFALWNATLVVGPAAAPLAHTVREWINDALMAVFFLLVGLEIKRELLVGELASVRQALLPIAAAIGGMVLPAAIYAAFNAGGDGAAGWGIPMATDIAFALGVLALLGPRVPVGLKVFLAALAIVDDMGAVLVIALFYTQALQWSALLVAAGAVAVLLVLNAFGVKRLTPFLVTGVLLWLALLSSGVHATIAGVLLALTIPARTTTDAAQYAARGRALLDEFDRAESGDLKVITSRGQQEAILELELASADVQGLLLRLEHALTGVVSFGIMPLFALANAGVRVDDLSALTGRISLGVMAGLLLGKPLGVGLASWLAVRSGAAALPAGVTWRDIRGASLLAGIGFTMSLFVAGLAFGESARLDAAKLGVLLASAIAGVAGYVMLRRSP